MREQERLAGLHHILPEGDAPQDWEEPDWTGHHLGAHQRMRCRRPHAAPDVVLFMLV